MAAFYFTIWAVVNLLALHCAGLVTPRRFDSLYPFYDHDPNTPADCSLWWNSDDGLSCETALLLADVSVEELIRWNPSMRSCNDWIEDWSYCISSSLTGPVTQPGTTTATSTARPTTTTTTATTTTTTTTPGNGIQTPLPTQPGMTSSCNRFYFVKEGDQCGDIITTHGITLAQFTSWNTGVGGASCSSLWANTHACVGVIGFTPVTTTTARPTTTTSTGPTTSVPTPIRSVQTPSPTQPNMAKNCYQFYFVKSGDTCATVASRLGISVPQIIQWNPAVGSNCAAMWASTYLCVAVRNSIPTSYHHGCFIEPNPDRALTLVTAPKSAELAMNVEYCAVFCMVQHGTSIFGVQGGTQCRCGNAVNANSLKVPDSQCNRPCVGNDAQTCGGVWRYNMYSSSATPPITYKHHGCATMSNGGSIFGVARQSGDAMTVARCAAWCLGEKKTSKFALFRGRECACGNNPSAGSSWRPESECGLPCSGNSKEKCGGDNARSNVYSNADVRPVLG